MQCMENIGEKKRYLPTLTGRNNLSLILPVKRESGINNTSSFCKCLLIAPRVGLFFPSAKPVSQGKTPGTNMCSRTVLCILGNIC
jgi:hypothetical protein